MVENVVLTNKVTNSVLELDMVTTPVYILDNVDWGQIGGNHHSYKFINQVGILVTNTSLESRDDVSVTGWVIAKTEKEMDSRKRLLNNFVNPKNMIELKYKDYVLDFLPNTTIKYSTTVVENNEVMCKFKIQGMAPNPLFKQNIQQEVIVAGTKGMFHFPLCINAKEQNPPQAVFGLRQPSLIIDIYNGGDMDTGMTIVFKAKGTVSNPSLINVETLEFFKINKTMVSGEIITVNTIIGSKKITGVVDGEEKNYFKYKDFDSKWLQLAVGDNYFRYDADQNIDGLDVNIYFYNQFLEVQQCY